MSILADKSAFHALLINQRTQLHATCSLIQNKYSALAAMFRPAPSTVQLMTKKHIIRTSTWIPFLLPFLLLLCLLRWSLRVMVWYRYLDGRRQVESRAYHSFKLMDDESLISLTTFNTYINVAGMLYHPSDSIFQLYCLSVAYSITRQVDLFRLAILWASCRIHRDAGQWLVQLWNVDRSKLITHAQTMA